MQHDAKRLRVVLHTLTPSLAKGFVATLEQEPSVEPLGSIGTFDELLTVVQTSQPHVVLLDIATRVDFARIQELRNQCPAASIVLWIASITVETAHYARTVGIRGVLPKNADDDLLIRCIRTVAAGDLWFERSLLNSLLQVREVRLSPRERQLFTLIAQGLSNKQLGAELMISEGTVKVYLAKLFRKVGVHDRYELALHGLRSMGMSNIEIGGVHDCPVFLNAAAPGGPHTRTKHRAAAAAAGDTSTGKADF